MESSRKQNKKNQQSPQNQQIPQNQTNQQPQNQQHQQNQQSPQNKVNKNQPQNVTTPTEDIYLPKDMPIPANYNSIYDPKKVNLSRHYEDCDDIDVFCRSSFTCKFNRCFTKLEIKKQLATAVSLHNRKDC